MATEPPETLLTPVFTSYVTAGKQEDGSNFEYVKMRTDKLTLVSRVFQVRRDWIYFGRRVNKILDHRVPLLFVFQVFGSENGYNLASVAATFPVGPGVTRPHLFLQVADGNTYTCWREVFEVRVTLSNVSSPIERWM